MDQLRLEQYHILFERMIRCTSDPQHFDREEFVQVLREFGILFRLSKGITEFYRSESAEKAHDGEIMVDYDTGQKGHPVLEKRFITKSGAVIRSTMFMADGE